MNKYVLLGVLVLTCFWVSSETHAQGFNFQRDLTLGSSGTDVVALQNWLEANNYLKMPVGVAKGHFGELTQAALIKFQLSQGIIPPVGYFGPITQATLEAFLNRFDTAEPISVEVISPRGGERWKIGSAQEMEWEIHGNIPAGTAIMITAHGVEDYEYLDGFELARFSAISEKSYSFVVPSKARRLFGTEDSIEPGRYKILITLFDPAPCDYGPLAGICAPPMIIEGESRAIRIVR